MKTCWKTTSLSAVSDFITKGATPTTYGYDWVQTGIPFLRSECVANGTFNLKGSDFISEEAHKVLSRSAITGGDILISITGYIGKVCRVPGWLKDANINQHIARVRINSQNVDPEFVFQYLQLPEVNKQYQRINTGQAYPQLSLEQIRNTFVPLPPLLEQRKIAEILSCWDEGIEKSSQSSIALYGLKLQLINQLLESNGNREKVKLGQLAEINPQRKSSIKGFAEVSFVRMAALAETGDILEQVNRPYEQVSKGYTSFLEGDVLLAKITPCFENGKCGLAVNLTNGVGFGSTEFHVLRAHEGVDARLLLYAIQGTNFRNNGSRAMTGSAGQKRLPAIFISNHEIRSTTKHSIKLICDLIESVELRARIARKRTELLKKQKQALMQKLLTGKIRVKV